MHVSAMHCTCEGYNLNVDGKWNSVPCCDLPERPEVKVLAVLGRYLKMRSKFAALYGPCEHSPPE